MVDFIALYTTLQQHSLQAHSQILELRNSQPKVAHLYHFQEKNNRSDMADTLAFAKTV